MRVKQNSKRNLQKEQEEIKLDSKYIPEKYPEPSIVQHYICRGNPETAPAFRKQSSALHQIHVFKDSKKQDNNR